jgi:hypothetical protein
VIGGQGEAIAGVELGEGEGWVVHGGGLRLGVGLSGIEGERWDWVPFFWLSTRLPAWNTTPASMRIPCGSELARDGGVSAENDSTDLTPMRIG